MSQVEVTDPRQDKAKVIDGLWQRLSEERKPFLDRGLEARRYLTAHTTDDTEVGSLPWKNKTTIPKLTQIKDNLQAFYMAAAMPDDEFFRWEGDNEESHQKANLIEAYVATKVRMGGFREELEKVVNDWITYGNCFIGVQWEHSKKRSNLTGEEIDNYIGPRLMRISPNDCVIDPRAPSFDKSPFIRRRFVSLSELMTHNESGSAYKYDEAALQEVLTLRRGDRPDWTEYYRNVGYEIDGFQGWSDYFQSQYVEILEFWGDLFVASTGEVKKNQVVMVAERAFVLLEQDIPTWNGKKPFAHAGWRVLPDNLYGQGPLDNLIGMQYRCDHLENLKADVFDQIVHPMVAIKGDDVEDFNWEPGGKVYLGVDGDIEVLRPDGTVRNANTEIAIYHNLMEQMAGSPREMMGFRSPGEKTAFEVNVLQQGADRNFQNKLNRLEAHIIEPALNMYFEMIIRNLDVVDMARVFNDETKALQLATISKEDVVADGSLRPVGAKHFAARSKRVQEIQNFLALMQSPNLSPHFSGINAAKALEQELGFEKYNLVSEGIGLREQIMLQSMAQQAQESLDVQQGISPEAAGPA